MSMMQIFEQYFKLIVFKLTNSNLNTWGLNEANVLNKQDDS